MADFQSTTDFTLKSVVIYPLGSDVGQPITNLVNVFTYVESILSPSIAGTLEVVDSVGSLSISGGMNSPWEVDLNKLSKILDTWIQS